MSKIKLSDEAKFWAVLLGYTGVAIGVTYLMYLGFAKMIGRQIVKELLKAGVITIAVA